MAEKKDWKNTKEVLGTSNPVLHLLVFRFLERKQENKIFLTES
jgi:hypothetical protein